MDIEDLKVYQMAIRLIVPVERLAKLVEVNDRELARNLRKTSRQIPPAIGEGFSRRSSQPEFKRYIAIAMGSSDEIIVHLNEVKMLQYPNIKEITCLVLMGKYKILSKRLNRLISSIKQKSDKVQKSDI